MQFLAFGVVCSLRIFSCIPSLLPVSFAIFLKSIFNLIVFCVLRIFQYYAINDCIHIEQFKWRLVKKASQVLYLHFALKKRAFIEELQEKQEQVGIL